MSARVDDRTVTVSWSDPSELAGRAAALSGVDFLRAIVAGELPRAPIQELLGFELVEADEGRVVFELEPGERHSRGLRPPTAAARPTPQIDSVG